MKYGFTIFYTDIVEEKIQFYEKAFGLNQNSEKPIGKRESTLKFVHR